MAGIKRPCGGYYNDLPDSRISSDLDETLVELNKIIEETTEKAVLEEQPGKVEKQNYYNRNGIEAKDIIRAVYQFYGSDLTSWEAACVYNIIKYLMRYKYKESPKNDLDKLIVNVNWLKKEI